MSSPQQIPKPAWHVTSVDLELDTTVPGASTYHWKVSYLTDSGVSGFVYVQRNRINDAPYVQSLIAADAQGPHTITMLTDQG